MRTKQKDGYERRNWDLVEFVKPQRVNKAMTGHFKKAQCSSDESDARSASLRPKRGIEDETEVGDWVLVETSRPANRWISAE